MPTKSPADSAALIERFREIVSGPLELVIEGATAYWLEGDTGQRVGAESDRSLAPLALVLDLTRAGRDPDTLNLCARLANGERFEIGGGIDLVDIAEHAAGIPGRPRIFREE